jgi:hypothetical protein
VPEGVRVHVAAGLKPPLESVAKVTDPVGVLAEPAALSVTVAEHVDATPVLTGLGAQDTPVALERAVTERVVWPLLGS